METRQQSGYHLNDAVLLRTVEKRLKDYADEVKSYESEVTRLRALVEAAFAEGVLIAARSTEQVNHGLACWPASKAKNGLYV
ncbi:MAG: hypothetical protein MUF84_12165 [Anaerolineae bacterium]|jgi:hypothetical protein|nr:hypothetical protein [Anaerolineae bacterium]